MSPKQPVDIGVVGIGHLGNFHIEQLKQIPDCKIIGIYDIDLSVLKKAHELHSVPCVNSLDELLTNCDAVSIVTPTRYHFDVAKKALDADCHLFIEKPITKTINQAKQLLKKAEIKNKFIQVGHIEQFNPAFLALDKSNLKPVFIESHRLSPFNRRGTDVPVVLDLMIHDIDIVLSLVNSGIKEIKANGVRVVSDTVDIANARIEFENGCVTNLTASRISQKKMRKIRLFQENTYTTIDFLTPVCYISVILLASLSIYLIRCVSRTSKDKYV